jgi:hypothetical protein
MAPALYELLAPYGDQCVVIGFAAVCRGSVSTQLGRFARKSTVANPAPPWRHPGVTLTVLPA